MNARVDLQPSTPWTAHAKQWRLIDVPLRPSPEDLLVYEERVAGWQRTHPSHRVHGLLLGVTAELATMSWPAGTSLLAVDRSHPMVSNVWPRPAHGAAICADWRALPLGAASRDVALGDGAFSMLPSPQGYEAFVRNLRRVLTDDGLLVLRCYCSPEKREPVAQVFADLHARRIASFHAFKWRLAMALQQSTGEGIRLADIWDCWSAEVPDPDALAARCGWPAEVVRGIQIYRGVDTRYTFPTLAETRRAFSPAFSPESLHVGTYELAERCPILAFRPR
jgi:hypothetical protein